MGFIGFGTGEFVGLVGYLLIFALKGLFNLSCLLAH